MGNPLSSTGPTISSWDKAKSDFLATGDPDRVLGWRTAEVDSLVIAAWTAMVEPLAPEGVALFAVGGYGRRQLFPYSDIDLMILFGSDRAASSSKLLLGPFLQHLWDLNLRVSQSVRTVEECVTLHDSNVELNVSLLDARQLAGDAKLGAALAARLPKFVHANRGTLVKNLIRLTTERHAKFGGTIFHLEPNIKETPGGLRDYQLIGWLTQIRSTAAADDLGDAQRFLFALRCHLHYQSNRDQNVLGFESQERVAQLAEPAADPAAAAALWMRQYFRHARAISRVASRYVEDAEAAAPSLFRQFRDWRQRLSNAEFSVLHDRIFFRAPGQLDHDPFIVLRLYEFSARHGLRVSPDAERRITERIASLREFFSTPRAVWEHLRPIFEQPHVSLALRSMHETGLLEALFPELQDIDSLVIRDFYHRYTVDEHTLVAIQVLEELHKGTDAHSSYATLRSEVASLALLYFGLLFHDAGKGTPNMGHVDAGVRIARTATARIGMAPDDADFVVFLIQAHLVLSATLNSRDLDDADTVRAVAAQVGTIERLKALTLLTYADISAVNPGAMTPWRAEQLFRLYRLTYRELTLELDAERLAPRPSDSPEKSAFLEGLPSRYLRTHSEAEIEEHFQLSRKLNERGVAIQIHRKTGGYRLVLITHDRKNLFAPIAGTLASFGMNILKAEAFANARRDVLDTFVFADPSRTLELNPEEVLRLEITLERVVLGKTDVMGLLRNRPAPAAPTRNAQFAPVVEIDNEASATSTLIHITAQDRPGLLYDVASVMSLAGCSIDVVLIDTEAHKAIDVFYVSGPSGKLDESTAAALQAELVKVCPPR